MSILKLKPIKGGKRLHPEERAVELLEDLFDVLNMEKYEGMPLATALGVFEIISKELLEQSP